MKTPLHEILKEKPFILIAICSIIIAFDDIIVFGRYGIFLSLPLIVTYLIQPDFQGLFIRSLFGWRTFSSAFTVLYLLIHFLDVDQFLIDWHTCFRSSYLTMPLMIVSTLLNVILFVFSIQFFEYSRIERESTRIPMYNNFNQNGQVTYAQ